MLLSLCSAAETRRFHVVLDPGHGGSDLGATRDSFIESEIVYDIAVKVKYFLDQQKLFTTSLTRDRGTGISLKNRVQKANAGGADLFVSLHANTSNSDYMSGMEFYFNSPKPHPLDTDPPENTDGRPPPVQVVEKIKKDFLYREKTEKSLLFTRTIKIKTTSNGSSTAPSQKGVIKRAPFYVIDHTDMPSVLVELGFISNRREAKKLSSPEYQKEIARQLADAILEYKEKSDKLHSL